MSEDRREKRTGVLGSSTLVFMVFVVDVMLSTYKATNDAFLSFLLGLRSVTFYSIFEVVLGLVSVIVFLPLVFFVSRLSKDHYGVDISDAFSYGSLVFLVYVTYVALSIVFYQELKAWLMGLLVRDAYFSGLSVFVVMGTWYVIPLLVLVALFVSVLLRND